MTNLWQQLHEAQENEVGSNQHLQEHMSKLMHYNNMLLNRNNMLMNYSKYLL